MSGGETWRQTVAKYTTAIPGVNANSATLVLRIAAGDGFTGGDATVAELRRTLRVKYPSPVQARLIDGENYIAGDRTVNVDWAQLQAALSETIPGDPAIIVGGVRKTLSEVRPFDAAHRWGIQPGMDTFTIGGVTWSIVRIDDIGYMDGTPAKFSLTLRR